MFKTSVRLYKRGVQGVQIYLLHPALISNPPHAHFLLSPVSPPVDPLPSTREYWMIYYRGLQAFLRSYDLASCPPPLPTLLSRQQVVSLCQSPCVSLVELTDRWGGEGDGRGVKSNVREKAWHTINHSILSALTLFYPPPSVLPA